ncbi:hypothetical protein ACHAXR_011659 [Thalassiosira sp. AJA248-18]
MDRKKSGKVPQRRYADDNHRLPKSTPIVGLGCSSFSTFFSSEDEESLTVDTISRENIAVQGWVETIRHAVIDRGINLLDTAPWYGHGTSEVCVGYALDTLLAADENNSSGEISSTLDLTTPQKRKRTGSLPRSDLIINTKVGRYDAHPLHQFDFSYNTTINSVRRSLERLNCTYIDVIQLHDPEFSPSLSILKEETVPALLECRRRGWAKAIGLTGYPLDVQHQILVECDGLSGDEVTFDQSLVYCHNNLHDMSLFCDYSFPALNNKPKRKESCGGSSITYAQYCRQSKIHLMAAAPLSMGLLTPPLCGPPSWHPASSSLKEACAAAAKLCDSKGVNISSLALLYSLSQTSCTLLGMKDIEEVDVAADLAMRFCDINFDIDESMEESNNQCQHSNIDTILGLVLSPREKEVLALLSDKDNGPFATVISNGEYRWNGKVEAKNHWELVDELKRSENKNK